MMKKWLSLLLTLALSIGLIACKDKEVSIIISFDSGNDQLIQDIIYHPGDTFVLPNEMVKEGFAFEGWYIDFGSTIPFTQAYLLDFNEDELVLYAKWSINSYKIDFETNGGTQIESRFVTYHDQVVLPDDPIKLGYQFLGWFQDEELETPYAPTLMNAEPLLLYAKWGSLLNYFYFEEEDPLANDLILNVRLGGDVQAVGYRIIIHYNNTDLSIVDYTDSLGHVINDEHSGMIYINYVNINQPMIEDTLLLTLHFSRLTQSTTSLFVEVNEVIDLTPTYEVIHVDYHPSSIEID